MSDLVGNPYCSFSHARVHLLSSSPPNQRTPLRIHQKKVLRRDHLSLQRKIKKLMRLKKNLLQMVTSFNIIF